MSSREGFSPPRIGKGTPPKPIAPGTYHRPAARRRAFRRPAAYRTGRRYGVRLLRPRRGPARRRLRRPRAALTCPGGDLPHVHSRFYEPTEYFGLDALVVGGGNSAVYAALALSEARANINMAMRRPPVAYQSHLRPFVVRDLEFAVNEKKLTL